jgi:hypothetical protein
VTDIVDFRQALGAKEFAITKAQLAAVLDVLAEEMATDGQAPSTERAIVGTLELEKSEITESLYSDLIPTLRLKLRFDSPWEPQLNSRNSQSINFGRPPLSAPRPSRR